MSNHERFLKSCLCKYKNPDITERDVLCVFKTFDELRPKLQEYEFNDRTRKLLLQLDGTIPVNYKGSIYNIPICIWLMDTHPYNPPMVYVRPISSMVINIGRHVDKIGKVDLPYLRKWKYPNSDLVGLIQILTLVFGEEPPVLSKSQSKSQSHKSHQNDPSHGQYRYPGVSKQYDHYPASVDKDYPLHTGFQPPVSANKQHARHIPLNRNRKMAGTEDIHRSTDNARRLDQVSGRKVPRETENNLCQDSAEDFDIHCDPCNSENNFVEAESFCLVCKEYFCKACLRYHRKISATKTHRILGKDEMPRLQLS